MAQKADGYCLMRLTYDDTMTCNANTNTLNGGLGNDTLSGGAGPTCSRADSGPTRSMVGTAR